MKKKHQVQLTEIVKCWNSHGTGDSVIVTIPKSIRFVTGIKADDRFFITNDGNDVLILKKITIYNEKQKVGSVE